jgi:hypothetical protein
MLDEQFDINRCTVSGVIQRIWDRGDDLFLRLAFVPEADKPPRFLTLRLPSGKVGGQLISLQPGETVNASGYLVDEPYEESLREFLRDARKNNLLEKLPGADDFYHVSLKRVGTRLDVTGLEMLKNGKLAETANAVDIQGVVAKVWEAGQNLMVRLAIYDRGTSVINAAENGSGAENGKRPRRKAHYVTARFADGEVDGKSLKIHTRNRLRLNGSLQIRFFRETLRDVLIRSGNARLLENLDGHDPDDIYAIRDSVFVDVNSAIVLASLGREQANALL